LDPFKDWVCEQLAVDPRIQPQRLRELAGELGYEGGRSIFDEFIREVRPRYLRRRTFQRTVYRPGELVQCDLWEPRERAARPGNSTNCYIEGWTVLASAVSNAYCSNYGLQELPTHTAASGIEAARLVRSRVGRLDSPAYDPLAATSYLILEPACPRQLP
jgi:hypothetical protein